MVLLSFANPKHIPLLLSGAKLQTTRAGNCDRFHVGDTIQFYYKASANKKCTSCISPFTRDCFLPNFRLLANSPCDKFNKYIGDGYITGLLHLNNSFAMNSHSEPYETQIYKLREKWIEGFDMQNEKFMNAWARADGFESLSEAHIYFTQLTGDPVWMTSAYTVILFSPSWLHGVT